jgi:hypothetical protein
MEEAARHNMLSNAHMTYMHVLYILWRKSKVRRQSGRNIACALNKCYMYIGCGFLGNANDTSFGSWNLRCVYENANQEHCACMPMCKHSNNFGDGTEQDENA